MSVANSDGAGSVARKVCAIVGAGGGLSLGIARKFGRQGFSIALVSRNEGNLDRLCASLAELGIAARGFPADVTDQAATARAFEAIRGDLGEVEVIAYNPEPHTPAQDLREWQPATISIEAIRERMELTLYGMIYAIKAVLPGMLERRSGTILVTMGGSAVHSVPNLGAVAVTMAAARSYVLTLNEQIRDKNVIAANVMLTVLVEPGSPDGDPDVLARNHWKIHANRGPAELMVMGHESPVDVNQRDMQKFGIEIPAD